MTDHDYEVYLFVLAHRNTIILIFRIGENHNADQL